MKTITVPVRRPVNGGTPIPGDWKSFASATVREIRPLENIPPFAVVFATQVEGQSLQKLGIFNNDWLICYETTRYIPGKIGIWDTPHGQTAKFAYHKDGSVVLHNHNGWKQAWASDEVKLVAIAARVERDLM
jgi:SOS-response transcriptional repressor LexA